QPDAVAVVRPLGRRLRLAQPDRAARAREVPDRLAALAFDLADAMPAERLEQRSVERQAAQNRGNDDVYVMNARGAHCPARTSSTPGRIVRFTGGPRKSPRVTSRRGPDRARSAPHDRPTARRRP